MVKNEFVAKTVAIDGGLLATIDAGSGRPLLLVHGFPLDHRMWRGQLAGLSRQYRVIAPDLRGFGASPSGSETVSLDDFADDLAQLLDALDVREPVVYCGLSMGGYIGWAFWRRHSRRLRALIQCDTRAAADTAEVASQRITTAQRLQSEGPAFLADTMIGKLFSTTTHSARPGLVEEVRATILANNLQGMAAASRAMAARRDVTAELPSIAVPSLIVVGAEDVISTPAEMRTIAEAMPHARFEVVPAAGHMSPLEQPEAFNRAVLDFLH